MSVLTVVPFGGDNPHRQRNLQLVLDYYRCWRDKGMEVGMGRSEGPEFNRAAAVNAALESHWAKVLVVNDADSLVYPSALAEAIRLAATGDYGIVRAYTTYQRIDKPGTLSCRSWQDVLHGSSEHIEWAQDNASSHGVVALNLEHYRHIGGYDERFQGWGYEDCALDILSGAFLPGVRVPGPLFHLWHPPAKENPANLALLAEYEARAGAPEALLALRKEDNAPVSG